MGSPEREVRWARAGQNRPRVQCSSEQHTYSTRLGESGAPSVGRDQDWGGGQWMRKRANFSSSLINRNVGQEPIPDSCPSMSELRLPSGGPLRSGVEGRSHFKEPWNSCSSWEVPAWLQQLGWGGLRGIGTRAGSDPRCLPWDPPEAPLGHPCQLFPHTCT